MGNGRVFIIKRLWGSRFSFKCRSSGTTDDVVLSHRSDMVRRRHESCKERAMLEGGCFKFVSEGKDVIVAQLGRHLRLKVIF